MEGQRFFRLGYETKMMKMDQMVLFSSIFHQVGRHLFTGYFSVHSHNGAIKPRKCRCLGMRIESHMVLSISSNTWYTDAPGLMLIICLESPAAQRFFFIHRNDISPGGPGGAGNGGQLLCASVRIVCASFIRVESVTSCHDHSLCGCSSFICDVFWVAVPSQLPCSHERHMFQFESQTLG